ncbi:MAG TPA: DUF6022 family protein [Ktedonobacteraceae bacterium]
MNTLRETFFRQGKSIETLAAYVQQFTDENWQRIWEQMLPKATVFHEKGGDHAYAVFALPLFQPLAEELASVDLIAQPHLPGDLSWSWEEWGPQQERERRLASVVSQKDGEALGTLVIRFFHDHTQLRLPRPLIISSLRETDREAIAQAIQHIA